MPRSKRTSGALAATLGRLPRASRGMPPTRLLNRKERGSQPTPPEVFMKIRFQLPAHIAQWREERPHEACHYSQSWALRGEGGGHGKLIGWIDLYKPEHTPKDHLGRPYRWSMDALLERDEPAGWVATLEEGQAEILKRLGSVGLRPSLSHHPPGTSPQTKLTVRSHRDLVVGTALVFIVSLSFQFSAHTKAPASMGCVTLPPSRRFK